MDILHATAWSTKKNVYSDIISFFLKLYSFACIDFSTQLPVALQTTGSCWSMWAPGGLELVKIGLLGDA